MALSEEAFGASHPATERMQPFNQTFKAQLSGEAFPSEVEAGTHFIGELNGDVPVEHQPRNLTPQERLDMAAKAIAHTTQNRGLLSDTFDVNGLPGLAAGVRQRAERTTQRLEADVQAAQDALDRAS